MPRPSKAVFVFDTEPDLPTDAVVGDYIEDDDAELALDWDENESYAAATVQDFVLLDADWDNFPE